MVVEVWWYSGRASPKEFVEEEEGREGKTRMI
jgi:hypothetical protein